MEAKKSDRKREPHNSVPKPREHPMPVKNREPRPQGPVPAGYYSNQVIIRRNGGVRPLFVDDIGGCSANYR